MTDEAVIEKITCDDRSFADLLTCADSFRNTETPVFLIDGSIEKNSAAEDFLQKYNFVVVEQSSKSEFSQNCANLKPMERSGHKAFAFLHQKQVQSSESFRNTAEPQLIELLDKEMSDFIPDATAHSQEAWNLRCDKVLRQFFSTIYSKNQDCTDQLLPSIESLMQCDSSDENFPFSMPTLNYNPTWSRAPHVISAYHLHAHYTALQTYYTEYMEQLQSKKSTLSLENNRNKQRWLHRIQKELIATAKKVILGKRATNQMVQDAAFHAKKENVGEKETCVEAMRPLQAGYEAFILTSVESESAKIELIPAFDQYYPYYLACRRAKWSNVNADCLVIPAEDEYSKAIFDRCSIQITMRTGATLIISRTTPRRTSATKCTFLPLSYRWQKHSSTLKHEDYIDSNSNLLEFAQICPFELALNATYQKSIFDGIVFTSLPHLTGAAQQFSRSTKKTSQSLKVQRQEMYNAWLATLAKKSDRNLPQYHYSPPKISEYLLKLISQETYHLKFELDCLKEITNLIAEEEKEAEEAVCNITSEVKCEKIQKKRKRETETEFNVFAAEHQKLGENCFAECEMLVPNSIFENESRDDVQLLMEEFGGFE